jgi:hypothetical protein
VTQPAEPGAGIIEPICPHEGTHLEQVFKDGKIWIGRCPDCHRSFLVAKDMIDLGRLHTQVELGDDQVRAALSPDTKVPRTPVPVALDVAWGGIHRAWLEMDGQVRGLMARLQNRAHFLHGELARQALAHPELHPLAETAKQIIDIVAARPEGIPVDGG